MKLVRDRIPEIIEADGSIVVMRTLDKRAYITALGEKLFEEASELISAPAEEVAGEAADVLEVLAALCKARGVSMDDVAAARLKKAEERGAFERRILLLETRPRT